ncbi:hypothetical protein F4604DRAFT_1687321 [Suillus subluteus]|nr:hypothetical protein F4604DRAFT_1687321 [Suillus subluteus]
MTWANSLRASQVYRKVYKVQQLRVKLVLFKVRCPWGVATFIRQWGHCRCHWYFETPKMGLIFNGRLVQMACQCTAAQEEKLTKWATGALNTVIARHANIEASRGHRCYPLPQSANQGLFLIKNECGFVWFENIAGLDGIVQIPLPLHPSLMDYATHLHILLPLTFLINATAKRDAVDRNPKRKLWAEAAINILNTARENIEHKLHLESAISLWTLAGENYFCTLLLMQRRWQCAKRLALGWARSRRTWMVGKDGWSGDRALDYSSLMHVHCVVDLEDMNTITVSSEERHEHQLFGRHTLPLPNKTLTVLLEIPRALDVYARLVSRECDTTCSELV